MNNAMETVIRVSLSLFWVVSGIVLLDFGEQHGLSLISALQVDGIYGELLLGAMGVTQVVIGIWLMTEWRTRACCFVQLLLAMAYIGLNTWSDPASWLQPMALIANGLPIVVLIGLLYRQSSRNSEVPGVAPERIT